MKKSFLSIGLFALVLAGCSDKSITLEDNLKNPLFAERYSEELVDRMVEYKIQNDPILEDEEKMKIIEETRKEWMEIGSAARKKQNEGYSGFLISMKELTKGELLYVDNMLYTDTLFDVPPGPDLRFYISTVVDPRDVKFPDETAIDLGELRSTYGAHAYVVPPIADPQSYRTIVLWDNKLEQLYGFAQVSS